ncbi:uncharacterized protein LOC120257043 [Dioscorea cayenensis subsp. rotundata]|uniref:Uncharacterized protein LOC120257043 n=1 Tax=Dioscorea cayennensis subsp. rotundata TaxID=55577 RepID=A0AB40B028_DIOCR|nr:uncharacterized protein LOC120257043 [Dioscorea cayenensis subsp. rotundata]
MVEKFLGRYIPPSKAAKLRQEISTFKQGESETLFEAYERFKDLLRRCPHHSFASWMRVQIIYNALNYATCQLIDAAVGGSLSNKYPDEVEQLLESMASNDSPWASRGAPQKGAGIYEFSANDALAAKVDVLSRKLDLLMGSSSKSESVMSCSTCRGGHEVAHYPIAIYSVAPIENVDYIVGQRPQGNFITSSMENQLSKVNAQLTQHAGQFNEIGSILRNLQASVQSLEHQVGQLAKATSERPSVSLPSNTEENPREHLKAIALRSGKQIETRVGADPSVKETREVLSLNPLDEYLRDIENEDQEEPHSPLPSPNLKNPKEKVMSPGYDQREPVDIGWR